MKRLVNKTVNLNLVGVDGNAYVIMGMFQRQAEMEEWTEEEIKMVMDEAQSKDYNHLLNTIQIHCEVRTINQDQEDEKTS